MVKEEPTENPPKNILLRDVPADVWQRIQLEKVEVLRNNSARGNVSHHEAIYRLIRRLIKE